MADVIRCPVCSKLNPPEMETCAFCGAPLKPGQSPAQPNDDEPDWLSDLRSDDLSAQSGSGLSNEAAPSQVAPEKAEEESAPGAEADLPDWLSRIRERNTSETGPAAELPGQPAEDADWMKDLHAFAPQDQAGDDDWLSRLGEEPSPSTAAAGQPAEPEGTDLPDWLRDFSAGPANSDAEDHPQSAQDEYSWLENAGPQAEAAPVLPDETAGSGDDLSSFLARLEGSEEEPTPAVEFPSEPAEEGSSEWTLPEEITDQGTSASEPDLSGFLSTSGGAKIFPAAQSGDFSEDSFPNWPQFQQAESSAQPGVLPEPESKPDLPTSSQPEDIPGLDWLQNSASENLPTSAAQESAGLPDWLSEESPAQTESPQAAPAAEDLPTRAGDHLEAPLAGVEGLTGWFDGLKKPEEDQPAANTAGIEPPAVPEQAAPEVAGDEQTPDWLRELGEEPSEAASASVPPLIGEEAGLTASVPESDQPFAVELPDWLNEEQAASEASASEASGEPANAELDRAELPDWVKEMRPIESIIPEQSGTPEADQRVEKAGPLAGLPGILPVEDVAARYRKPPVYSMKLRVTEKQRSQSSLFDSILAEETQPLQLPRQRKQTRGTLLRVVLALILLVALALPLIPGMNFGALVMPALFPRDMQDMFNQIDKSLAPETPVLLAVDYEPALSGEMSLAAASLVGQLEAKNTRIVVVSTNPAGPALASQLLTNAQQTHPQYDIAQRTVDLGYLPGGATSLLAFANQPQMVAPDWQYTYLKNLPGLQGFSQIILLTDRAETGRAWVEQVQPAIGKVPLFIVASAQAAPLLEPYVGSGQVAGMVRGVLGGVMYGQLAGQNNNPAVGYLSAYQIGIGLAFVLVLLGGLISGGATLLRRDQKDGE